MGQTMSIVDFPAYNHYNIADSLRKLANEIDEGMDVRHCFITMLSKDEHLDYRVYGEDLSKLKAVGLLEYVKLVIAGAKR